MLTANSLKHHHQHTLSTRTTAKPTLSTHPVAVVVSPIITLVFAKPFALVVVVVAKLLARLPI